VIDPSGRVLNGEGEPIPGLYAGGGTACGLAGPHSDGCMSGNGLLSAFGTGWIIGTALSAAHGAAAHGAAAHGAAARGATAHGVTAHGVTA
jgi:hypothetical protein